MLPKLETDRLVLREVRMEDGPALQAFQHCESQWRHQAIEPEELADGTLRVHRYMEHRGPDNARRLFVYVAALKSDGILMGQVSLQRSHPAIAHLGFSVDAAYFGNGYATEMADRLLAFGFGNVGIHRIAADVAVENAPCIKVLEKIGMAREGVARDCIFAQGKWWTEAKYAILEDDRG
jgi:RimJ/RimL family protein N-acetyltransferase